VAAANLRFAQELRKERYYKATAKAAKSFRIGDNAAYVAILHPFEDMLSTTQKKKLEIAARRMQIGNTP
jgi:hypothetical protein